MILSQGLVQNMSYSSVKFNLFVKQPGYWVRDSRYVYRQTRVKVNFAVVLMLENRKTVVESAAVIHFRLILSTLHSTASIDALCLNKCSLTQQSYHKSIKKDNEDYNVKFRLEWFQWGVDWTSWSLAAGHIIQKFGEGYSLWWCVAYFWDAFLIFFH